MDRSLRPRKGQTGPRVLGGQARTGYPTWGCPDVLEYAWEAGAETYRAREPSYVRNRTPAVHFSRVTPSAPKTSKRPAERTTTGPRNGGSRPSISLASWSALATSCRPMARLSSWCCATSSMGGRIMTATTPTEDPCIVEPRGFPADLLARLRSWRRCTNAMKTR
jgi:hypothetical protein